MENSNNLKAIIYILIGMTVFAVQDTLIKLIIESTNLYLIYFVRSIIGLSSIYIYLKLNNINIIYKTNYPVWTAVRTIAFFFGFSLYYFSLSKLSLPVAVTLFFVSPFFTSIFSMFLLNEHVGIRRWSAIIVGFIGVYLVLNPDYNNFNFYSVFPVICAFCYSLTIVIQKKTSDKDNVFSQIIHIYISALIFSTLIKLSISNLYFNPSIIAEYQTIFIEWKINNILSFLFLILIGFTGVAGFFCLFSAYNIGSPPSIAPFEYIIIIWSLIIGWVLWSETLTIKGFCGLILIISAGIYTFLREAKLNKKISIDRPLR
tara:strand:+ start:3502 stop:4449 length:948 start_codon:yes stop_codon:yes gene_type:complete